MRNRLHNLNLLLALAVILAGLTTAMTGCSNETDDGETRGQHQRERKSYDDEGEESGTELGLDETYDLVRNGVRLNLVYDKTSNSFVGTVENTTDDTLEGVRVEVHLSNGIELGPTKSVDLAPGERIKVTLSGTDEVFDGWTPHAEVGAGEHGGEHGKGDGEHGGTEGEHGGGGD